MTADVENPDAGQGPVVLDIGGDVGALIVTMPTDMVGVEVDIIPAGDPDPDHSLDHQHAHDHPHGHDHPHDHGPGTVPHVAVVARPTPSGEIIPSLVYGEVREGSYRLRVKPDGPDGPTAEVTGGEVTFLDWA